MKCGHFCGKTRLDTQCRYNAEDFGCGMRFYVHFIHAQVSTHKGIDGRWLWNSKKDSSLKNQMRDQKLNVLFQRTCCSSVESSLVLQHLEGNLQSFRSISVSNLTYTMYKRSIFYWDCDEHEMIKRVNPMQCALSFRTKNHIEIFE